MEEEMEIEMEMEMEKVDFDFDYEFDASRFFDFTRPESKVEARRSETWFEFAASHPPSPFVSKLFPNKDLRTENAGPSSKSKYENGLSLFSDNDIPEDTECCNKVAAYEEERGQFLLQTVKNGYFSSAKNHTAALFGGSSKGLLFYNHIADDMKKIKGKTVAKTSMPRSSTLMKPTASQLAKQNQRRQVNNLRFQKDEGTSNAHFAIESQAPKRQKLDGGVLHRIADIKQPINLIHKAPKKDPSVQCLTSEIKTRITLPREPELQTEHRTERTRFTSIKKAESPSTTTSRFNACPSNKKILEAPVLPVSKKSVPHSTDFQTFHLKPTSRAKHHPPPARPMFRSQSDKGPDKSNTHCILETRNKDNKRSDMSDAPSTAACHPTHTFKARPLDRKILTSRGDIGVFRNTKRDVTVPKEFTFQTAKRNQQNPPIDLFSKLSLAGEPQSKSCAQLSRKTLYSKGSKENRLDESCCLDQNIKNHRKEKPNTRNGKQIRDLTQWTN